MAKLTVNGEAVHYKLDPSTPLLWALRDASNLTGTKYGCDTKDCGACTVIVDGRSVMSCMVPIGALDGSLVTTIEGLSGASLHPVQQAWLAEQATMCGACEPGFIMAIAGLIAAGGGEAGIDALPNKCRCGAYPRIRRAALRALRAAGAQGPAAAVPSAPAAGAAAGPGVAGGLNQAIRGG